MLEQLKYAIRKTTLGVAGVVSGMGYVIQKKKVNKAD